jgi:SET domain-containing protein
MAEKKPNEADGYGLYSKKSYFRNEIILSESEWYADLTEDWITLSVSEVNGLSESEKEAFLKYSFDIAFGETKGTFHETALSNPANFINHSCHPNTEFDGQDNIRAKRDIRNGEELTIDYGTFTVNFDQTFVCGCGHNNCRKLVRKDDWKQLANPTRTNVAKFIRLALG